MANMKAPPHNNEAEQSVLGCMLLKDRLVAVIMGELNRDDFYHERHALIFDTIASLHNRGTAVDLVTVSQELINRGVIEMSGGLQYLASLTGIVPALSAATSYCAIIKHAALSRRLISYGQDIAAQALDGTAPGELLDSAAQGLLSLSAATVRAGESSTLAELAQGVLDQVGENCKRSDISGITSGIYDLDQLLWGWQKSDLIILAARPSMGKTTMALNFSTAAARTGSAVAFFSLEMSRGQLAMKVMSELSQVPLRNMQRGVMTDTTWPRLVVAAGQAKHMGGLVIIDDTPALSVSRLRTKLKLLMMRTPISLVVVDYLQLMTAPGKENRTQEVSEISRSLKALAKELGIPVIALAQLNRGLEGRTDKRPMMADLRESGAIEQDADIIIFLYRDEVYNRDSPTPGVTEINVAKHRNGETDKVSVAFNKYTSTFQNLTRREDD
jgi:replicative DNA helicase